MRILGLAAVLLVFVSLVASIPYAATLTGPLSSPGSPQQIGTECTNLPVGMQINITSLAPWYCPINNQIAAIWKSELPLAEIALLIAFSIASIIFAVGAGMKSDRIRNFGIGELYEATASAIIIILFLFVSATMFGLVPSFIVGTINPYSTALGLMNSTINGAEGIYSSIFHIYLVGAEYSSIKIIISTPVKAGIEIPNFYSVPISFFVLDPSSAIAGLLIDGITALFAEYYLLIFFALASIPVFLVPGVILRALFPTRALGGMLIAMAMGFYLVAPSLFALAYYFTTPNLLSSMQLTATQLTRFGSGTGAETNGLTSTSPLPTLLQSVNSEMSSFWLLILFYPALIVAVTYAFITQVASFIGGASYTGSRLRSFI
jgi:hypothetical protein